jgi:hypothetical protein
LRYCAGLGGEVIMIRTIAAMLALGLTLGGCMATNPPSDVVLPQRSAAPPPSPAKLAAEAEAREKTQDTQCRSYGAKLGSAGYKKCRADLAQLDEAARVPPPAVAAAPVQGAPGAAPTAMAATESTGSRRSRPMLDEDSTEAKFNVCSYGGTITNCY